MTFKHFCEYFIRLESTTLRNEYVKILADLYNDANPEEVGNMTYLLQGRVAPLFTPIEFGLADKMMIRAISLGLGLAVDEVTKVFKNKGDLGKTVEQLKTQSSNLITKTQNVKLTEVFNVLYQVAIASGAGSQDSKIRLLGELLHTVDALSAKFIVRITLAKLRLGFSDMTVLDALSWMIDGTKSHRGLIEGAYNVRPDLGFIAETVKSNGVDGLKHVKPTVGTPILMARAERMSTAKDIIEKIGTCAIEPKYDGFRIQVHYSKNKRQTTINKQHEQRSLLGDDERKEFVRLYSRNLEDVTPMYPDIVEGICRQLTVDEAILEGEAIAFNPNTGEYLPFQETVQRKRKYNITEKSKEVPLKLFAFDLLVMNDRNLLFESYVTRRSLLDKVIKEGDIIQIAQGTKVESSQELERIFQDAVSRGLEGVMAKKLQGIYQAGARDFNWIKYKRSYQSKLDDTVDAVVMGYDFGQGKRQAFGIGDFLIGVRDEKRDMFVTIAKIGTGLTDNEWKDILHKMHNAKLKAKPREYDVDKMMGCDVWVQPKIVVEIRADEITRSPVHTAGRIMKQSKSGNAIDVDVAGFALRFPRLERFRDDKKPNDATSVSEIEKLYTLQEK
jgi:DNA ligase 1